MKFTNPANGYVETSSHPWLWAILFGPFYFAFKGAWAFVFISFVLALLTLGLSSFVFPFFARRIVEATYLRKGWMRA